MNTRHLWLDTDIGSDIDDAVALAYLLRQRACRLVGISTATGAVEERSQVAAAILAAAGREDVPIYSGYADVLSGPGQPKCPQADALTDEERRQSFPADPDVALAALVAEARARPGQVTLLTIGPLTNVARFFEAEPELPELLRDVVLMGGFFWPDEPGAEWNALCDPEAARLVAEAPVARFWYGLDVTRRCTMPAAEVRARFTGDLLSTVTRFAEVWFQNRDHITFHDPLAAAGVFAPDLCSYDCAGVEVETTGDHPGRTVPHPTGDAAGDQLARTVRARAFFDHFFATLG